MVKTRVELYGVEETVVRPVMISVVDGIKNLLSFDKEIYTIFTTNDKIVRNRDKLGNLLGKNTILQEGISVEAVDMIEDGMEISPIANVADQVPIYIDDDIDSSFIPIYINRKVIINFKYFSKSKSNVQALLNRIRLMTANDSMHKLHQLEYYYTLPNITVQLLNNINDLKNKRELVKPSLQQYIADRFDTRAEFVLSPDNILNKASLAIREAQVGVQGYIADDIHGLTVEYDDSYSGYYLNFNYEFYYEKPSSLQLMYPLLVYNSYINKMFRNFIKKDEPNNVNAFRSYGTRGLATFNNPQSSLTILDNKYYLTVPSYDNYRLNKPTEFTVRLFSVLIKVSDENPYELFKLEDIPELKFKDNILHCLLTSEREFINSLHESIFHIELYKNNRVDPTNKVILDQDGTLRTLYPMDYRFTYHVVFNILTDLDYLSEDAKQRTRECIRQGIESGVATQTSTDNLLSSYITVLNIPPNEVEAALAADETT